MRLTTRFAAPTMPVPGHESRDVRRGVTTPVPMWLVVVAEVDGPRGLRPIDRVLDTSAPVPGLAEAMRVVAYSEERWRIEESFKASRSGRQVTERQLKTEGRLEAPMGLLAVVAVRPLRLEAYARADPSRPAVGVVPPRSADPLKGARGLSGAMPLTAGRFYRELAELGGFLGRKHDGAAGWITIWRGRDRLQLMMRGAEAAAGLGPEARSRSEPHRQGF